MPLPFDRGFQVKTDAEKVPHKTPAEERVDGFLESLSKRRRDGIRKSLERPLRIQALRAGYISGCILIDMIALPVALVSVFGRIGLIVTLGLLVPLVYLEYRVHNAWFERDWKTASQDH